jgi:glyoxylase-like metal-dependent hydrolase (beta-lactamase superfamily II)
MQEIAPHIFIETAFPGLTVGAICTAHGPILIDTPFRQEDIRTWRAALQNLSSGTNRLLVNLDAHIDRTLGARGMDCTIIGHEKLAEVFRSRPVTFKAQPAGTGSEWELFEGISGTRWLPPDISFTEKIVIRWDDNPLILEQCPGPSIGAVWADLPDQGVLFLGDMVVSEQPPFLAGADIPLWIAKLQSLLQPNFQNYLLVSGRSGLIHQDHVYCQLEYLEKVHKMLNNLAEAGASEAETATLVKDLLVGFITSKEREVQFSNRLRWGLRHYYIRHYLPTLEESLEE